MSQINSKILIGIIILIVLLGGAYYLIQKQFQPVVSPSVNNNVPSNPALTNIITIQNFAFNPGVLTVKVGTTITWTNQDSAPHRINSNTFNSAILNQGDSFSFTFSTAGSFDYTCELHPSMSGKVVVQ